MKNKLALLFFLSLGIIWSSCKRDPNQPRWNTNILTPIVNSTLTLNNLVADSLIHVNADSTVSLVYKNPIYTYYLDSLFTIPDTTLPATSYGLSSLSLGNQSINYNISLGQLLTAAGYGAILGFINHTMDTIPAVSNNTVTSYHINADTIFQSMILISGNMTITITNGFPIPMDSVGFSLADSSNPTHPFFSHMFNVIPPFSTVSYTQSIAGDTISGQMIATLDSVKSPGSSGAFVLIDTSELLKVNISTSDLVPLTATAKFPAQDLIRQTTLIPFSLKGVKLTEVIAQSGQVNVDAFNNLPDTLFYTYVIPPARKNNLIFKEVGYILPAPDTLHPTHVHNVYDLSGYTIDLKGVNENSFNTLYFNIIGSIDSSKTIQTLGTNNRLSLQTSFTGLVPYYARGYLSQDTVEFGPSSIPVNLFSHITSGTLNLNNVKLSLSVDNGIGVDAKVKINNIQAVNTKTGATKTLAPHGAGYQNPFMITRATESGNFNNPVNVANSTLMMDHSNSNDTALVNILPDKFNYDLMLYLNPNGNTSNYHDFAYQSSGINASLNMEIPLNFMSNQLTLVDTSAFSIGSSTQAGNISSGNFFLDVTNGFPLSGTVQMFLLNSNGTIIDSLFSTTSFDAPPIGNGGIVRETKFTRLVIPISESKMQNVFKTTKAIIKVSFTTANGNQNVKIYSDYKFGLKLIGDFTYKVQ